MNLIGRLRNRLTKRKRKKTQRSIHDALDCAYRAATEHDISITERLIIFSDQHKGARDGADDFQRCERAYNAALAYYNHLEYHLIELGDVEELWENSFEEVAESYPQTLALAARFHADGRYTRIWGNHDLAWSDEEFAQRMVPHGFPGMEPIEALRLVVHDGGQQMGELFLAHGHQGTASSDRHKKTSKFLVRYVWRALQRHLNRPWNTPSMDWALRGEHAHDLAEWASTRRRVLITGHTHLPVFFESAKVPAVTAEQVTAEQVTASVNPADPERAEALRQAWLEWAMAEVERVRRQQPIPLHTPCYFNAGCCSFGDGDITGLEISEGRIRLVRWPCVPDTDRVELQLMQLSDVFNLTQG